MATTHDDAADRDRAPLGEGLPTSEAGWAEPVVRDPSRVREQANQQGGPVRLVFLGLVIALGLVAVLILIMSMNAGGVASAP